MLQPGLPLRPELELGPPPACACAFSSHLESHSRGLLRTCQVINPFCARTHSPHPGGGGGGGGGDGGGCLVSR